MVNPTFPSWTPKSCIAIWEQAANELSEHEKRTLEFVRKGQGEGRIPLEHDPEKLARSWVKEDFEYRQERAIYRLLTNEDMRLAYSSLARNGLSIETTLAVCRVGLCGPTGSEKRTPVEREAWKCDVTAAALHLAKLIELSPLDEILVRQYKEVATDAIVSHAFAVGFSGKEDHFPPQYKRFFPNPSTLSGLLRKLAEDVETIVSQDMVMPRPGDRDASRAYFVRRLSEYFVSECGKPLRATVAKFASAAFDCEMSERAVVRLAP